MQMLEVRDVLGYVFHYPHARAYLDHYLSGTGTPMSVDPTEMLREMPSFRLKVATELATAKDAVVDSGWKGASFNVGSNDYADWYYAFNNFQYRVSGSRKVFTVEVRKDYNWGIPSENRLDLTLPKSGPTVVDIPQPAVARLNSVGLARDFTVYGASTMSSLP